ncbi:MAG: sodium:alanine symporter family protein [Clostridia bacterium]|nr:sodium:alanine symporter family protein [Clostridia bacterium]
MNFLFVLPLLVSGVGLYFLIKLKFFFIFHPIRTGRMVLRSMKNKKTRHSLCLALAGTLGVGNIFGVCAGIMIGGAGSVFWLLVSAIFSMIIKYCECLVAHESAESGTGGMHRVILHTFRRLGKPLSMLYALLCTCLALFMGSAIQSNAVSDVASCAFKINPYISAFILAILLLFAIVGNTERIEKITAKLIPLTTIFYILLTLSVILVNIREIPRVISDIITSAFSPLAAGGGFVAFFSSNALHEGYARGILSNEAGVGTSSLAHTRSTERTAAESGLAGMLEVFFDTVLLCMLTAFALLSAMPTVNTETPMSAITNAVTSSLSEFFALPLAVSILIFAYSTVICWYYYGTECVSYLVGERAKFAFSVAFFAFLLIGAVLHPRFLISTTDIILLFMCILTLTALIFKRERIFSLSEELCGKK